MTEDYSDQKRHLIEVAIELFSAHGYTGTSIRDIAQANGTSISNIYHYFGNKDGLLVAILQNLSQILLNGLYNILSQNLSSVEGLEALVQTHMHMCTENMNAAKIFLLDAEHFSTEGNKISRSIQRDILNIYVEQLRRVQEEGLIKGRNLRVMAFNILACINWQLRWFRHDGSLTAEKTHKEISDFILYGVLGDSSRQI
jgi:AcrR family transcriptional regulator